MATQKHYGVRLRRFEILGLLPDTEKVTVWCQGPKEREKNCYYRVQLDMLAVGDRLPDNAEGILGYIASGHRNKGFVVGLLGSTFKVTACVSVDQEKAKARIEIACKEGAMELTKGECD